MIDINVHDPPMLYQSK